MSKKKPSAKEAAHEPLTELLPGASEASITELLKALHLLTRDGHLNADARRKLKQIRHLLGLLSPALDDVLKRHEDPIVVDAGAGKSYLGFLLDATRLSREGRGRVLSIEARPELVERTQAHAARFGCTRVSAIAGEIASAPLPERVHMVTALHACDTATDDAIIRAVNANADWIAVVPCCQAEVARQLSAHAPADAALAALCAHPWHRRELGSHLTNVVRALALQARGYHVTVTELTGWEHSLKNELILAKRIQRFDRAAQAQLDELVSRFGIQPAVVRGLPNPQGQPLPPP